jgi:hypothetical protein
MGTWIRSQESEALKTVLFSMEIFLKAISELAQMISKIWGRVIREKEITFESIERLTLE